MATSTTRLGLTKPDSTDLVDIAVLNTNANKIDAAAGAFVCTSTTRPSTPYAGQIIYETDTDRSFVWDSGTSTWNTLVPGATVCTSASRPASPVAGQVIYETDTKLTYVYASAAWVPVINDKAVSAFSPIRVADATARDALFTSPVQGDRVFRTDRQIEEVWFGLYNASTNISGAKVAGWYPASGQAVFFATATRSTVSGTTYAPGTTGFTYTELTDPLTWRDPTTNPDRIIPKYEGIYRATISAQWGASGTGNRLGSIQKNSGDLASFYGPGVSVRNFSTTGLAYMNGSTDYFNAAGYVQDSGGSLTLITQVMVEFVRPSIA